MPHGGAQNNGYNWEVKSGSEVGSVITLARKNWFIGLETKSEMNSLAIGVIGEIMGDISTTAERKVFEIALTLMGLELAWGEKKALFGDGVTTKDSDKKFRW